MKVKQLHPKVEQSVAFELFALMRMSDGCGCYCLANAGGDILYLGQAASVKQRLQQHFAGTKRSALTPYGRVSVVWWREERRAALNALERGWIESALLADGKLPPLNRTGAPI